MESHGAAPVMVTSPSLIPEHTPNPELLRSLGRLVRGLSALFWGLPLALIVCVQSAKTDLLQNLNIVPGVVTTGWLLFGLMQLGSFQKQERVWVNALDRAKLLAVANLGLSPFLYWWNRVPGEVFFATVVQVMAVCGLLFLDSLNLMLSRLGAMLPDENLRTETKHFTMLNRLLVLGILLSGVGFNLLLQHPSLLPEVSNFLSFLEAAGMWVLLFLVLLPLAVTMAMIWKIKEAILDSVFGA